MNKELYAKLEIDTNLELNDLLEAVENKQGEYLERAETASSEERRQELELLISKMDDEIADLKKQIKSVKISKKVENLKKIDAEKKEKERQAALEKARKEKEKQEREKRQAAVAQNKLVNPEPVPLREVSNDSDEFLDLVDDYYDRFYDEVFVKFKELAEEGDASAEYVIGIMYQNGFGVKKDNERAKFWFFQSAEAGEPAGMESYGKFVLQDSGSTNGEKNKAFKILKKAAAQNDYFAMEDYVDACLSGKGGLLKMNKAIGYCNVLKKVNGDDGFDISKNSLKRKRNEMLVTKMKDFGLLKKLVILLIIIVIIIVIGSILNKVKNGPKFELPIDDNQTVVINVDEANVRTGPGTDNDVIMTVSEGERFNLTGNTEYSSDGHLWYEVEIDDGSLGWISEKVSEEE